MKKFLKDNVSRIGVYGVLFLLLTGVIAGAYNKTDITVGFGYNNTKDGTGIDLANNGNISADGNVIADGTIAAGGAITSAGNTTLTTVTGYPRTSLDTQAELETALTDVTTVYTNNNIATITSTIPQNLSELDDVNAISVASPDNEDVLTYDFGNLEWKAGPIPSSAIGAKYLNELLDVNTTGFNGNSILGYDGVSEWVVKSYVNELDELTDTNIVAPVDKQFLHYNAGTSKWVNHSFVPADIDFSTIASGRVIFSNGTVPSSSSTFMFDNVNQKLFIGAAMGVSTSNLQVHESTAATPSVFQITNDTTGLATTDGFIFTVDQSGNASIKNEEALTSFTLSTDTGVFLTKADTGSLSLDLDTQALSLIYSGLDVNFRELAGDMGIKLQRGDGTNNITSFETNDSDLTDDNKLSLMALGGYGDVNTAQLTLGFDASDLEYQLYANEDGTGILYPITLSANEANDQITLTTGTAVEIPDLTPTLFNIADNGTGLILDYGDTTYNWFEDAASALHFKKTVAGSGLLLIFETNDSDGSDSNGIIQFGEGTLVTDNSYLFTGYSPTAPGYASLITVNGAGTPQNYYIGQNTLNQIVFNTDNSIDLYKDITTDSPNPDLKVQADGNILIKEDLIVQGTSGIASIAAGTADTTGGSLDLFGDLTTAGGILSLHNSADEDTTTNTFIIQANDTLNFIADATTLLTLDESPNKLSVFTTTSEFSDGASNGHAMKIGTDGTTAGELYLYGNVDEHGGLINLYNANDEDDTTQAYSIQAEDTLQIIADATILITIDEDPASVDVDGTFTANDVLSGTYTPTLTSVANVAASTARAFQYMRVGNTINVSGSISVTATTGGVFTQIAVSLPVASNFANIWEGAGHCNLVTGTALNISGQVVGDVANDRVQLNYVTDAATAANEISVSFTYQIL